MSSQTQKSSRWGTFLSSVESRLDTILAEDDAKAQQKPNGRPADPAVKRDAPHTRTERSISPGLQTTPSRAQERLNERLARAVAQKNLGKQGDTTPSISETPSRTGSPAPASQSPRPSSELQRAASPAISEYSDNSKTPIVTSQTPIRDETSELQQDSGLAADPDRQATGTPLVTAALELTHDNDQRPSIESTRSENDDVAKTDISGSFKHDADQNIPNGESGQSIDNLSEDLNELRAEKAAAEVRWKEESQDLFEKLDALQAKLLYLTKEATEEARKAASEAKSGSPEKKLAEKDERIALLIEEGQKLSQTELKYMTLIKKLRSKGAEDEKNTLEARKAADKSDKIAKEAQDKLKRATATERQASDRLKGLSKLEKELESVKADRDSKEHLVRDLRSQLADLTSSSKQAEDKARSEALEQTRKKAIELEDNLSNLRAEKDMAEKEHQNLLREMREKAEREKERAKVTEVERQGELSILESRLEAYRARAEEASAGQGGDVQAKLLRQIETLQNQYAVASENWQGIEGSLVSRVSTLERERDESAEREAELRRKARETGMKNRRLEEELDKSSSQKHDLDAERTSLSSQMKSLREQLNMSEAEVNNAQEEFKAEREIWESRQAQRIEEERARMRDEFSKSTPSSVFTQMRMQSPVQQMRTRRSSNAGDHSSPQSRRVSSYQGLGLSNPSAFTERPVSRHSSAWAVEGAENKAPASQPLNRTDSMSTVPNISLNNGVPETPNIDYDARIADDDFFGGMHTPSTPPERTINDLVSASTAAGPSVQLVERMSAAVRRLESEKAAHKDELARLTSQRDESREQVVELMRDNEGKKAVDQRLEAVEKESLELKKRYETTLEMLGEKSEKVDELKADIVDLKAMMRQMVEERVR